MNTTNNADKEEATQDKELSILFPSPIEVTVGGKTLAISPALWKETRALLKLVKYVKLPTNPEPELDLHGNLVATVAREITKKELATLIIDHLDMATEALAIASRQPQEFIDTLRQDEILTLAGAVLKANVDFFTTHVLPAVTQLMGGMSGTMDQLETLNLGGPKSL